MFSLAKRNFGSSGVNRLKHVTIYGSGQMGAVSAIANYEVTLVDTTLPALTLSKQKISQNLVRLASKKFTDPLLSESFISTTLARISLSTDPAHSASTADLIIEAIPESLSLKHSLFSLIDTHASPSCIIASNTSSLSVTEIAHACPSRASTFLGVHFFNPVPVMKLVEIVQTPLVAPATVVAMEVFCKAIGKVSVRCKDTPGFIVNRLLVPYMMEALRMAEKQDASYQDIDTAMKLGAGYPMGPFELMDYVGLDTVKFITDGWYASGDGLKGPSAMLNALVAKGDLGKKSGQGFYPYKKV